MYTPYEQQLIAQLPKALQELSKKEVHQSSFENYCQDSSLPDLEPGTKVEWVEFYFSDDPQPAYFFSEGHLVSVNCDEIPDPSTFEIVGEDGSLYIQVEGHILLNRIKDAQMPSLSPKRLLRELSALEKLIKA